MQESDNSDSAITDVFSEFIEIALHNILHIRKLYPETIFERSRKYGVVVYRSIHPDINDYILNCIKAIHFHLERNQLKQFCLNFTLGEKLLEKYSFKILSFSNFLESDPFLVKLEQYLGDFLLKLHSATDHLDSLPHDCIFNIQLEVTEYAKLEHKQDPLYENFLWITSTENEINCPVIIPLHSVKTDTLNLQIHIEQNS